MTKMTKIVNVIEVEALPDHILHVTFSDGVIKEVGLSEMVSSATGVFTALGDQVFFERVRVNPETGEIEWPGEIDFDSGVLYGSFEAASGVPVTRRTIRPPSVGTS